MNEINIFLTMLKTTMLKHPKVVFFSDRSEFGLGLCFVFFFKKKRKKRDWQGCSLDCWKHLATV